MTRALGRVYFSLGTRCRITGAYDDAIGYLRQSMSHFRAIHDLASQASVAPGVVRRVPLHGGSCCRDAYPDDVAIALSHASEALDWFYSAGDRTGEARALTDLSNHYLALGDLQTARDYCAKALQLNVEVGHMTGQVDSLDTLGRIHAGLGDHEQAISVLPGRADNVQPGRHPGPAAAHPGEPGRRIPGERRPRGRSRHLAGADRVLPPPAAQ